MGMVKVVYIDGRFEEIPSYIYRCKDGRFEIRKRISGVPVYFGSFSTLEEAKLYRAYYIGTHWKSTLLHKRDQYIKKCGKSYCIIKTIKGHQEYFGSFKSIFEARIERDICVACNWDLDLIVEFDETQLAEV